MKISDEQYAKIGNTVFRAMEDGPLNLQHEIVGRAAVAAVAPLLLAEAAPSERKHIGDVIFQSGHEEGLRVFLANRLASVLAKPDPAVEAVRHLADGWGMEVRDTEGDDAFIKAVVAAVDAARAPKP